MKLKKLLEVIRPTEVICINIGEDRYPIIDTVESFLRNDFEMPEMPDWLNAKVVYVSAADKGYFSITVHLKGDKYD